METFNIDQELGIRGNLREGIIKYKDGDKIVQGKSLYVPGVGWCPVLQKLEENFTTSTDKIAIYCYQDNNKTGKSLRTWVGLSDRILDRAEIYQYPLYACDRIDIFFHKYRLPNNVVFKYYKIRGEKGFEHVVPEVEFLKKYDYFIDIQICDKKTRIFVTKEVLSKIQENGFANVRVRIGKNDKLELIYPESIKAEQFKKYDDMLISLNGYRVSPMKYGGTQPFYFMEDEDWRNEDHRYLIMPNEVITDEEEQELDDTFEEYDTEEEEVEALVEFFKNKGFTLSSQISNYIIEHELGRKFKHISGYLELENDYEIWEFEGGISPKYYREICERLKVYNKGTDSRVLGFESFAERD